jgi:fructose-1,6-bisphosphatase I
VTSRTLDPPIVLRFHADKPHSLLCHSLQFAFKSIAYYIRRASLINLSGLAGSANSTGDDQKKLDVIGNDIFISAMRSSGRVRILVSEEEEDPIIFDEHPNARYAVACDPIDGSSNLDAGVSVGTIFGIYKLAEGAKGTKEDLLRPGTDMVAAGFTMYGASSELVLTMKDGPVNGFTMDAALGEFILTHPNMQMPKKRSIYSVNEGNSLWWSDPVKEWCNSMKVPEKEGGKPYSARYIGSMVADAYRTLLYGGIFAYPADKKSPKGKLRILYECAPMAMVFEQGKQDLYSRTNLPKLTNHHSRWPSSQQQDGPYDRGRPRVNPRQVRHLHGLVRRSAKGHRYPQQAQAISSLMIYVC